MSFRNVIDALLIASATTTVCLAAETAGRSFATPEDAVVALIAAMRADDETAMRRVLGPDSEALIHSGDEVSDEQAQKRFVAAYDARHSIARDALGRIVLTVGVENWPLPIPIVAGGGRWHFDSRAGAQQLVERRIGRNEIAAIRTSLAYVDAQKLYFRMTQEYAQRLVSTPGRHDGLYWPAAEGQPDSPLEPLVEQAIDEGYPGADASGKQQPYQGYYFRILTGQGDNAPSAAIDYLAGGRMTRGFALVAWPAVYGASGIMTFEVNQDGLVFQKDLGDETSSLAGKIVMYDPDLSWMRVDIAGR